MDSLLGKLKGLFSRSSRRSQPNPLYENLDIGPGTRIFHSNMDGIFPHLVHIGKNCIVAPEAMILTHDASYYLFTGEYRVEPIHNMNKRFRRTNY